MPKSLTKEEAYGKCTADGSFIPHEQDLDKVKSMLEIAEEDLKTIADLKDKGRWNTLYKLNYDVLHTLCEAYVMLDKIKSVNHQCLFAYICTKYTELNLSWDFFEKIRTKRNGIHYYGSAVNKEDWKQIELQMHIYIKLLKEEIKKKL